jgi:hypothetical protein
MNETQINALEKRVRQLYWFLLVQIAAVALLAGMGCFEGLAIIDAKDYSGKLAQRLAHLEAPSDVSTRDTR